MIGTVSMDELTTSQLALFDQVFATVGSHLDAMIDSYESVSGKGSSKELTICGMVEWLIGSPKGRMTGADYSRSQLAELLSLAVSRLCETEQK